MTRLLYRPQEILSLICTSISSDRDLASVTSVCRTARIHNIAKDALYRRPESNHVALKWAAEKGVVEVAFTALVTRQCKEERKEERAIGLYN